MIMGEEVESTEFTPDDTIPLLAYYIGLCNDNQWLPDKDMECSKAVRALFKGSVDVDKEVFDWILVNLLMRAELDPNFPIRRTRSTVIVALQHHSCPREYLLAALYGENPKYRTAAERNPCLPDEDKVEAWLLRQAGKPRPAQQ